MNCMTFFKRLRAILFPPKHHRPKISLLVPFSSDDPKRQANFNWLREYWRNQLPNAEFIVGVSRSQIFCKGEALNDAVRKSTGKVLVILDADAYIEGWVIERCANRILEELENHLWYVPYRRLYRLNESSSKLITESDPANPFRFELPIDASYVESTGNIVNYGRQYGAMLMMFPRQAYKVIGSFDERFRGWGGEDVCLLRALDTLYGKHKTTDNNIYHLWHPFYGNDYISRRWVGQTNGGSNWAISKEYGKAISNPSQMRKLVRDGYKYSKNRRHKL